MRSCCSVFGSTRRAVDSCRHATMLPPHQRPGQTFRRLLFLNVLPFLLFSASSYENAFFYSEGEYTKWLCDLVQAELGVRDGTKKDKRRRVVIDVGGGTGNFTEMVIHGARESMEAIVIDPFLPASSSVAAEGVDAGGRLRFVKASAEDFIAGEGHDADAGKGCESQPSKTGYDHVLLKEVVHHFDANKRARIFAGLRAGLNSRGPEDEEGGNGASLLIVTRPQRDVDYPLWPAALEVWETNQPPADDIAADLREAGFRDVKQNVHPFPCEVALETWLGMIKNRFWSTFSKFTESELEEGCAHITRQAPPDGMLKFEERLLFIAARN